MSKTNQKRDVEVCFDTRSLEYRVQTLFRLKQRLALSQVAWAHRDLEHVGNIHICVSQDDPLAPKRKAFSTVDTNRSKPAYQPVVNLLFIDLDAYKQFKSQSELECCILQTLKPGLKNILLLENVHEYVSSLEDVSRVELQKFLLGMQMHYGMDYIAASSQEDSLAKLELVVQAVAKPTKQCPHFKEKRILTDKAQLQGLHNCYQLLWAQLLSQVQGISQDKAVTLVKLYPSFAKFLKAMQKFDMKTYDLLRGHGLSNASAQQLYLLMTSFNEEKQLFLI